MDNANRLLILDDDASVAMTIAAIAEGIGFAVRSCFAPDDFFEAVEGWRPSHIAVDLVMPTLDGMEVLRLLAERRCRAQVIVTSGMGTKVLESAQRSAAERGLSISGILPKPFRAQQLRSLLLQSSAGADAPAPASAPPPPPSFTVDEVALGLRREQFILHFQPKIDLATDRAIGFEALVRWQHPQHGLIPPDAFIPVLERGGEISQLTACVVRKALAWLADAPPALSVSINLSARDLSDLSLADWLARSCRDAGVAPGRLVLELTETSAMQDPTLALDVLTRLRIKGFLLGIDDFGTGYSSMVQLSRLPFSELKVDKSFVMSMRSSEESRKIVASTISLGRSLGLTTVAEGIEDAETAALLRKLGCEQGQGYHFGRPMSAEAVRGWLAR
jgi:EAL domain-containing protein (putative c-di-GMP-specific phosphodiesterase class I)/ActR/RegA family two-component response regulator